MANRCLGLILAAMAAVTGSGDDRIRVVLDASEADRVLSIVAAHRDGEAVAEADWQVLFGTEHYRRLKQREASMATCFLGRGIQGLRHIGSAGGKARGPRIARRRLETR